MKRMIKSSYQPSTYSNGFFFTVGNKGFFLETDKTNLTDAIARKFINAVCDLKGVGDKIREGALYDKDTLKDFKYRISKAGLYHNFTDKTSYWSVVGDDWNINYPEEDFANEIILLK